MGHKFFRKLFSFFLSFLLLFQGSTPYLVAFAQEASDATPSAEILIEPSPSPIPTPDPTPEVSPSPTPTPEPTPALSEVWIANDNSGYTTTENVTVGVTYSAPQDSKVSVTFKTLPSESGKLTIKEVELSTEQQADIGAFSNTAYDITSDMADGTFTYDLTLPLPESARGQLVEVKADGQLVDEPKEIKSETITITGLDHFTVFVISGTITNPGPDTYIGEPFDETSSPVIINEFLFNPSSGNEWIELFNKTAGDINLENWQLVDGNDNADDLILTGTLPANGILVFEKSGGDGWLNNAGSESITLKDDDTQTQDTVSYKDSSFVNGQNIGDVAEDQSVCRTSDGGNIWEVCSSSTKGWFNDAGEEDKAPLLSEIGNALSDQGISSNIGELDNPSNTPSGDDGLYFSRTEGKILFTSNLNLTNQATVAVLQSLGEKMEMTDGHIKFDSQTADDMAATGAKIYMYGLGFEETPDIIIKNDAGEILGELNDPSAVGDIVYDQNLGELSFTALHFTQFDLPAAPSAPVLNQVSSPTNNTTPTLSWDDVSATPEVTSYDIEIYDSGGINIYDSSITTTSSSFTPEDPLEDDDYTWNVRANNAIGSSDWSDEGSFTIETIAPAVQSIQTMDSDRDGYLDGIQLTFDEDINDSMLDPGNPDGWDVDGYDGESIGTGDTADDSVLVLSFNEGSTYDTENRPTVTYTPSGDPIPNSTHDSAGNELEEYEGVPDDAALPVLITAETKDIDASGQIDAVELTFSENIDDEQLNPGDDGWDVGGYNNESIGTGVTDFDNILLLAFDESGIPDTGVTPSISYAEGGGDGSTHDSAGNELASIVDFTSIDGAAPLVPEASPPGSDYDSDQLVSLTSGDESGPVPDIYYTTDGSEPNAEDGTLYTDPVLIDKDTTLKAIAYDSAGNASSVLTEEYGIAPVISSETSTSTAETSTTITWTTDDPATSRVIYDTVSHVLGAAPNYGYANSTVEDSTKVTAHSVNIAGLTAGTTYYYRTVSHGSPEAVSEEKSLTTSTSSSSSSSSSSSGGGGTSPASAPTCNDTQPGSAPVLLSAISAGTNSVILTWSKAADPVTYYLITFGLGSGLQQYGNSNVGGSNTTSYTVSGLSGGTTYYFKVRAGNGCAPGAFSNELSATPAGGVLTTVPEGFEAGVLGETTEVKTPESTPTPAPEVKGVTSTSSFNWWLLTIPGALFVLFISGLLLRRRT